MLAQSTKALKRQAFRWPNELPKITPFEIIASLIEHFSTSFYYKIIDDKELRESTKETLRTSNLYLKNWDNEGSEWLYP